MNVSTATDFRQLQDDYAVIEKALNYLDEEAQRQPELSDVAAAVNQLNQQGIEPEDSGGCEQ